MEYTCDQCRVLPYRVGVPIGPYLRAEGTLLVVVDYPATEDAGLSVMGGPSKRAMVLARLLSDARVPETTVSYAAAIGCLTKSKSLSFVDYEHCAERNYNRVLSELSSLKYILALGSIPARTILKRKVDRIDELRGKFFPVPDHEELQCMVSYSLSVLTDEGCGACGRNTFRFLVEKDFKMLRDTMHKEKLL